jgi:hypothetical protein
VFGTIDLFFEAILYTKKNMLTGNVFKRPAPKREQAGGGEADPSKTGVTKPGLYLRSGRRLSIAETIEERMARGHRMKPQKKKELKVHVMEELGGKRALEGAKEDTKPEAAGNFTLSRVIVGTNVNESVRKQVHSLPPSLRFLLHPSSLPPPHPLFVSSSTPSLLCCSIFCAFTRLYLPFHVLSSTACSRQQAVPWSRRGHEASQRPSRHLHSVDQARARGIAPIEAATEQGHAARTGGECATTDYW